MGVASPVIDVGRLVRRLCVPARDAHSSAGLVVVSAPAGNLAGGQHDLARRACVDDRLVSGRGGLMARDPVRI
jgi:hypothetical protein